MTRLFSYIVTHDSGFAPNPFHGYCTLACCKPVIRRVAQEGDWVVGLTSGGLGVVYAVQVDEKLTFADYWTDPRFKKKQPTWTSDDPVLRCGDNIYEPLGGTRFRQLASQHSLEDGTPDAKALAHDLGGKYVLVGRPFVYFGADAHPLPRELAFLEVRRGHRSIFEDQQVGVFLDWVNGQRKGVRGKPARWPVNDQDRRRRPCA